MDNLRAKLFSPFAYKYTNPVCRPYIGLFVDGLIYRQYLYCMYINFLLDCSSRIIRE
jgi:hypothetical protein